MHECQKFWLSYDVTSVRPSVRNPTMLIGLGWFAGKLHRQLRLTKTKRTFEDNKIQSQFM